jgi:hypothetical protein
MKGKEAVEGSIVNGVTTSDKVNEVLSDSRNGGEEVSDDCCASVGHLRSYIDNRNQPVLNNQIGFKFNLSFKLRLYIKYRFRYLPVDQSVATLYSADGLNEN